MARQNEFSVVRMRTHRHTIRYDRCVMVAVAGKGIVCGGKAPNNDDTPMRDAFWRPDFPFDVCLFDGGHSADSKSLAD